MNASNTVSNTVNKATNKISKIADEAAEEFSEKKDQLKKTEEQLVQKCIDYTRENPLTSVGIALGVGFVLSRLFNDNYR